MAGLGNRTATASKAREAASKKSKLRKADELAQQSHATINKQRAPRRSAPRSINVKVSRTSKAIKKASRKLKLDTLPAEIQQQIYWHAIDHETPTFFLARLFTVEYHLVRVSRAVQAHVVRAIEVWGTAERKELVKQIVDEYDHILVWTRARDASLREWSRKNGRPWEVLESARVADC